jgi:glycosyltransferase involved in cell wall biosynthesis
MSYSTIIAERLGEKARRFAERNSWDKIASQFDEALKEAIKSKNGTIY